MGAGLTPSMTWGAPLTSVVKLVKTIKHNYLKPLEMAMKAQDK